MFSKEGYIIPEKKLQQYKSTPTKEWVSLSEDEVEYMWEILGDVKKFSRAIQAKLKEKNHEK